jgi:vitamin B12 transporter
MFRSLSFFACIISAFLFIANPVSSQEATPRVIPEVKVIQGNKEFFSDDQTTYTIDPELKAIYQHQSVGYLLSKETPVLVNSYGGAGSLASASVHGAGSSHTQVSWNGFLLNSPASGQVDLSLVPSDIMQSVEIINGASGAVFGNNTFGGSIQLNNEPDWNNKILAGYSTALGSFGFISNLFSLQTGNEHIQYHLTAVKTNSENSFPYTDYYKYGSPELVTSHNAYETLGLIQNLFLKMKKGNHLNAGFWYQQKSLEIPILMGSYKESNATQRDSIFRSYLHYQKINDKSVLNIKTAYFSDLISYTDKNNINDTNYSVNSRIDAGQWMNETDYRYFLSSKIIIGGGASYNLISGISNNYGSQIRENEFALFGNMKITLPNLIMNAGIRKEFYEGLNPKLQYSFGLRVKPNDHLTLRSSFSSKFRKPTFNEKYWKPGGNPLLRPEKGKGGEIALEWASNEDHSHIFWLDINAVGYLQWVDNWIQWVFNDSLRPVEFKKVQSRGIETWINYGFRSQMFSLTGYINYNFNRSLVIQTYDNNPLLIRKQLMYTPVHMVRTGLHASLKGFILGVTYVYTGLRETVETADKHLRLPDYSVFDVIAGYQKKIKSLDFSVDFRIDNIFNRQYEIIRSKPMPGRAYLLTIRAGYLKSVND